MFLLDSFRARFLIVHNSKKLSNQRATWPKPGFLYFIQRCQASAVAVSVAIAMMLQRNENHLDSKGHYKVDQIIKDTYDIAVKYIEIEEQVRLILYHFLR